MLRCVSRSVAGLPARLVTYSKAPRACTAPLAQHAALALGASSFQRRLCSSVHGPGAALKGASASTASTAASAQSAPTLHGNDAVGNAPITAVSEDKCTDAALTAEEQAAADAIISRIQGLSPEDQQLILNAIQNPASQKSAVMGGPGIGPATGEMVAAFTCGRCDYRMVKRFSKHAYTKGIVIVECPNCRVKHLIADNLGWIEDEARTIEDILREKGESFVRIGEGDYQVVVEPSQAQSEPNRGVTE